MNDAPNDALNLALDKISSTHDRFQEAHFWIHMLERYYHSSDPFRWHLNSFLRAAKEVPQLLLMELQNEKGFKTWFRNRRERLEKDPLLSVLGKQRDFIVHRGMLVPNSHVAIGVTEGRGMKLGMSFPSHPLEDSDHAMDRYLLFIKDNKDILGVLTPDDDSMPCVEREWKLPQFENDIVEVCAVAWLRLGETISEVVRWLGADVPPLSLDCRHTAQRVRFKLYARDTLIKRQMAIFTPQDNIP